MQRGREREHVFLIDMNLIYLSKTNVLLLFILNLMYCTYNNYMPSNMKIKLGLSHYARIRAAFCNRIFSSSFPKSDNATLVSCKF